MNEVAELFRRLSYGVYVVGVADGKQHNVFTAAWVMQVSFDPLLLVLSINPDHASYPLVHAGGGFTVNVLKQDQQDLALRFGTRSGRNEDKLLGILWHAGATGAPILEEALAYFDCELIDSMPAGDHELVVGRVTEGRILVADAEPLTYAETDDMDGSSALYPRKL
jgi:flavin reductase (DIM6/NTAB) family NADH-FMN oxidoreductase RutF